MPGGPSRGEDSGSDRESGRGGRMFTGRRAFDRRDDDDRGRKIIKRDDDRGRKIRRDDDKDRGRKMVDPRKDNDRGRKIKRDDDNDRGRRIKRRKAKRLAKKRRNKSGTRKMRGKR